MNLKEAIQIVQIVVQLAAENIISERDARDNGVEKEWIKAWNACAAVEDLILDTEEEE